jgi:hypothetical protein
MVVLAAADPAVIWTGECAPEKDREEIKPNGGRYRQRYEQAKAMAEEGHEEHVASSMRTCQSPGRVSSIDSSSTAD